MIPLKKVYVLDVYGRRRLGRDYDYRYGGRRREKGRPGNIFRLRAVCWSCISIFLALGFRPLANIIQGAGSMSAAGGLAIFGVCAAVALFCYWVMRCSCKMYQELCEALAKAGVPQGPPRC